jgi:hypothetical protein
VLTPGAGNAFHVIGLAACVLAGYATENAVRPVGSRSWLPLMWDRIAVHAAVAPRLAARLG